MKNLEVLRAKLKAYFTANSWDTNLTEGGGCETCGYGSEEGFTVEKIHQLIDKFDPDTIE